MVQIPRIRFTSFPRFPAVRTASARRTVPVARRGVARSRAGLAGYDPFRVLGFLVVLAALAAVVAVAWPVLSGYVAVLAVAGLWAGLAALPFVVVRAVVVALDLFEGR